MASSSHEPEPPVANSSGDDPDELPEFSEPDGDGVPSTVVYRSRGEDAEADEDEENDLHSFFDELVRQEEMLNTVEEDSEAGAHVHIRAYLQEYGSQAHHGPIGSLDGNSGAK